MPFIMEKCFEDFSREVLRKNALKSHFILDDLIDGFSELSLQERFLCVAKKIFFLFLVEQHLLIQE